MLSILVYQENILYKEVITDSLFLAWLLQRYDMYICLAMNKRLIKIVVIKLFAVDEVCSTIFYLIRLRMTDCYSSICFQFKLNVAYDFDFLLKNYKAIYKISYLFQYESTVAKVLQYFLEIFQENYCH